MSQELIGNERSVLDATFFDRSAVKVAYDLIGCHLNWKTGEQSNARIITETECYIGSEDLASHASRGRTKRNEAMFGQPGTLYLYFVWNALDVECGHRSRWFSRCSFDQGYGWHCWSGKAD